MDYNSYKLKSWFLFSVSGFVLASTRAFTSTEKNHTVTISFTGTIALHISERADLALFWHTKQRVVDIV